MSMRMRGLPFSSVFVDLLLIVSSTFFGDPEVVTRRWFAGWFPPTWPHIIDV